MLLSGIYFKSAKCLLNEITKDSSKNFKNKIMRQLFFIIGFFVCFPLIVNAQEYVSIGNDSISLTKEEKEWFDRELLENYRKSQVTSIANVKFGESREEAERILRMKFGNPSIYSTNNVLRFTDIVYAGIRFNSVYFMFQSDGKDTFFNGCAFIYEVDDFRSALVKEQEFADMLKKKYTVVIKVNDENGNPCHYCGVSPLWDGTIQGFQSELPAIHTGIIKYSNEVVKAGVSKQYSVSLMYGTFDYVKDEF